MRNRMLRKAVFLILTVMGVGIMTARMGFNAAQVITSSVFSLSIFGTLLFWEFRLSFAFFGTTILLLTRIVTVEKLFELASMNIIIFLSSMMVLVGFLKELGFFTWLLSRTLCLRNLSARKFMAGLTVTSAFFACAMDEITSILFMMMVIFEISEYFEVDPVPFIIASVMATNIGSSGTVLGNPIGLLIATKAGFTFEDFIVHAFPVMLVLLVLLYFLLLFIFRKPLQELDERIKEFGPNDILVKLLDISIEPKLRLGFIFFGATIIAIAMHHRIELLMDLPVNTILFVAPLITASIIMMWKHDKARHYIEHDVEWWSLLFFLFLFAQSGVLAYVGVADTIAAKVSAAISGSKIILISTILFGGAIVSSILDNVVVVAALIPLIQSLQGLDSAYGALWWALLFGACYGGNITLIGSTANIVAIGTLEKERHVSIGFWTWLKIGSMVGVLTLAVTWILLVLFY